MNLAATLFIYCYGTSEGVRKEWDTRGRTGVKPPTRFMMLELKAPKTTPVPFFNDDRTSWHWNADKSSLIIEVEEDRLDESSSGIAVTTQYKVPKTSLIYWGPEETSPTYLRKKNLPPQRGREAGYVMPESERAPVAKESLYES